MRWISAWAWMGHPSSISNRIWLIFTNSTRGKKPDMVTGTEKPPERWQHGVKYCVYVHHEEIHDYTSATVTLDNNATVTPAKRRLPPWHLCVADSEPASERVFAEFPHHPPPPQGLHRSGSGRNKEDQVEEDHGSRIRGNRHDAERPKRDKDPRDCDRELKDATGSTRTSVCCTTTTTLTSLGVKTGVAATTTMTNAMTGLAVSAKPGAAAMQ